MPNDYDGMLPAHSPVATNAVLRRDPAHRVAKCMTHDA